MPASRLEEGRVGAADRIDRDTAWSAKRAAQHKIFEVRPSAGRDLAFEGYDVFTNSGPSGGGAARAFGTLSTAVFLDDVSPQVPFESSDATGGAFLRWWFYDGSDHVLYSRFHTYGVKDGAKFLGVITPAGIHQQLRASLR